MSAPADVLPDPCASQTGASVAVLGLHLAAIFGILAVSAVGVALPFVLRAGEWATPLYMGKVFAAGIILATGFVHVLPDAVASLTNPCLGLSEVFPWAFVFAGAAALLTFTLEHGLRRLLIRRFRAQETGIDPKDAEAGSVTSHTKLAQAQASSVAIILETGVIVHSIFIGIGLGISREPQLVRPLLIALMFHQAFEGLALGTTFIKACFGPVKYWLAALGFTLITPVGIVIGMVSNYRERGGAELAIAGVFDSISAGILIHNGLADLIIPAFSEAELPNNSVLQVLGFLVMFAGYAFMSFLAKWA